MGGRLADRDILNTEVLPTQNKTWGFYGTANGLDINIEMAWQEASLFLIMIGGYTPHAARFILDSSLGRHIADQISDLMHREKIAADEVNMEDIHTIFEMVTTKWKDALGDVMDEFYRSTIS